jgi:hypothetical protein
MSKSRAWCFTLNNYTEQEEHDVHEFESNYLICGREKGENGTPHLQGYVYFKNARHLGGVRNLLARAHWEIARGSPEQNREYCTKQGDYFESGILPMSQKRKGEVEQDRWKEIWKLAKKGELEEIDADVRIKHYRTLKEINKDFMTKPADLTELDNHWIWGAPGLGKSRSARILYPNAYFKAGNKWWDGYQGEENVIIDDFELDFHVLGHYIKVWADHFSFVAEHKGGASHIRPKRIIITSNYAIESVFAKDQTLVQAILRRFKVCHLTEPLQFEEPNNVIEVEGEVEEEPLDMTVWDMPEFEL